MVGDPFPMAHDDRATPAELPILMLRRVNRTTLFAVNVRRGRPLYGYAGAEDDWFKNPEWLDFVADLFDRKLRRPRPVIRPVRNER
jgi:hypothetical protein